MFTSEFQRISQGETAVSQALIPTAQDFEKLVQTLCKPGTPQQFKQAEIYFSQWQKSREGWHVADVLLQSQDSQVRFYGAMTFRDKIRSNWKQLNEGESASLLERLLDHLVRLNNLGEGPRTVKTLSIALISYYLRPSASWDHCVRHVVACLARNKPLSFDAFKQLGHPSDAFAAHLSGSGIPAALWFAAGLAEEAKKAVIINTETHKYHEKVCSNVTDVAAILQRCLNVSASDNGLTAEYVQEALKCFQVCLNLRYQKLHTLNIKSWVTYTHGSWIGNKIELGSLQSLTILAIQALQHDDLYEAAAEMLSDALTHSPAFLTANDHEMLTAMLCGPGAEAIVVELTAGNASDRGVAFARLTLAYGAAYVDDLARRDDPNLVHILQSLLTLLKADGYPGADDDDEICGKALDFWTSYVEYVSDSLFSLEPNQIPPWMQLARERILEVVAACWLKIRYPTIETTSEWDTDMKRGFHAFRNDVQDMLQTSYTLLGSDVFKNFGSLALESLEKPDWYDLESALFCLNALSEAVSDETVVEPVLSTLFASPLFAELANDEYNDDMPTKTKRAAITMITKYISFFERNHQYLPPMLNFLFQAIRSPALANVASKAIATACWSCRTVLVPELQAFINQYEAILGWEHVETETKEKVIGGIAAVVQALPTEESKEAPLSTLLQFIDRDARVCIQLAARLNFSEMDGLQAHGICALRCLASMGKALQTPDAVAIDIDAETPQSEFWMPTNSEAMEAACDIIRAGYKETAPGLFVFPAQTTVDFVRRASLKTSRLDKVLDTAAAMLSKHSKASDLGVQTAASELLNHAMILLAQLNYDPRAEPEIASSIVDLAHRYTPHYIGSMYAVPETDKLFRFTLACLASDQALPQASAAKFWATFVQDYSLVEAPANFQKTTIQQYGPDLCDTLIHGIAGDALRSSLDTLAEPLKKVVYTQSKAKEWLSASLNRANFPSRKVGVREKRVFLQTIMGLRGSKKTNHEVKGFWHQCRGPESNFT